MTRILVSAISAAIMAGSAPAMAQNQQLIDSRVLPHVNASEIVTMLADFGISSDVQRGASGTPAILAMTPGRARFIVELRGCSSPAEGAGCAQATVFTAYPSSGVTYDEVNAFNGSSAVTTAVFEPTESIIIFARNIFLVGGASGANVKAQLELFLRDMQAFVENRSSAGVATVSFNAPADMRYKVDGLIADNGLRINTMIAAKEVPFDREVSLAIGNSLTSSFIEGLRPIAE